MQDITPQEAERSAFHALVDLDQESWSLPLVEQMTLRAAMEYVKNRYGKTWVTQGRELSFRDKVIAKQAAMIALRLSRRPTDAPCDKKEETARAGRILARCLGR